MIKKSNDIKIRENREIDYQVSIYLSKFVGYHSKKQNKGVVKLFISKIWDKTKNFEDFLEGFNYLLLLERICLERAFEQIKMKNRCKPFEGFSCKMEYITKFMLYLLNKKEKKN